MTTRGVAIRRRDIQQPSQLQAVHRRPQVRRLAPKGVHVHQVIEIPLQITLHHHSIRFVAGDRPPPLAAHPRQVPRDHVTVIVVRVVRQHEIGPGLDKVPEGPDPAAAHGVEDAELVAGPPLQGGGEDAEVAADGALAAVEGAAGLELVAALGGVALGGAARREEVGARGRETVGGGGCDSRVWREIGERRWRRRKKTG